MISEVTFAFLKALSENNNTKRMHLHKDLYIQEKDNFILLIKKLIERIGAVDKTYEGLDVKKTLYRQNKDIRFTRDKRPYKKHFGARIGPDGKNKDFAGMYIHIEGGRSYVAFGMSRPSAVARRKVRKYIGFHWQDLKRILEDPTIKKVFGKPHGEKTSRLLKMYKDHPATDLLKYKSLYFYRNIPDKVVLSPDFLDYLWADWLLMKPFLDFLNAGLE